LQALLRRLTLLREQVWVWSLSVATLYGVIVITASPLAGVGAVWTDAAGWLLLTIALSSAAMGAVGTLVLPITAGRLLATSVADVLQDTAAALDR
jgi:hypothetical protein